MQKWLCMKYVLTFFIILNCSFGLANTLEKCLSSGSGAESTEMCAQKYIKNLTLNQCFSEAEKIKSELSKENLKQFCFYQVSEFPTLASCLSTSKKMAVMLNHDEAIFECVRQFQNQLNDQQCLKISDLLKYPEKKSHLKRKCEDL